MKMGDPGYFEREEKHDDTTKYLRYHAKEAVAFALTLEELSKEGIEIPRGLYYTDSEPEYGKIKNRIGAIIAQEKDLTIRDASSNLKEKLINHSEETASMYVGTEYFNNIFEQQRKRVLDSDVKHIDYYSSYGKAIDVPEIVKKIKTREANLSKAKASKGKGIAD